MLCVLVMLLISSSSKMVVKSFVTVRRMSLHSKLKLYGNNLDIKTVKLPDHGELNTLYYLNTGADIASNLPPLVIVGGTSQTINTFTPHIKQISKSRRLIIPEMRCQGRTDLQSKYGTMSQLVTDFSNFSKEIGLENLDLCGFSFGGRVALAIAAEHPTLVNRLSVTGVPLIRPNLGNSILKSWLESVSAGNMRDAAWSFLLNGYSEKFIETNHEKLGSYIDLIIQSNDQKKLSDLLSLSHSVGNDQYTVPNCASRITCTTQIIGATHDRIAGSQAVRDLANIIPGAHYEEIVGGHLVPFENPLIWRQKVLEFMS